MVLKAAHQGTAISAEHRLPDWQHWMTGSRVLLPQGAQGQAGCRQHSTALVAGMRSATASVWLASAGAGRRQLNQSSQPGLCCLLLCIDSLPRMLPAGSLGILNTLQQDHGALEEVQRLQQASL